MAYTGSGRFPVERASKIGHVKLIQEPRVQRLLEAFERVDTPDEEGVGELSGKLDLSQTRDLENVVAIDGSHAAIPNSILDYKRLAFITVSASILRRSEVASMKANPVVDPRDLAKAARESVASIAAALPLSGIVIPGETVVQTIRNTVDEVLRYTDLYHTLRFLVSREWLPDYAMVEHMDCYGCGREFVLPRSTLSFRCPHCGERHTLGDYLRIVEPEPRDWAREEAAISLRNVLETLTLMKFLVAYRDRPTVLRRTLFIKDGPLLLRAHLSRLVEPIRSFLAFLHATGRELHLVGIEKTGDLVNHLSQIKVALKEPGDYFLPTVRYLHERVQGVPYVEQTYRNRVQYGSKAAVRLGPDHVVVVNVPTGEFTPEPLVHELYGFEESMAVLSEMVSYSYENALIPLVLANSFASISMSPSVDILEAFAERLLSGRG